MDLSLFVRGDVQGERGKKPNFDEHSVTLRSWEKVYVCCLELKKLLILLIDLSSSIKIPSITLDLMISLARATHGPFLLTGALGSHTKNTGFYRTH